MANPHLENLTKDTWTKIADNVYSARLHFLSTGRCYYSYSVHGGVAPKDDRRLLAPSADPESEIPNVSLEFGEAVDIYAYTTEESFKVRVDTPVSTNLFGLEALGVGLGTLISGTTTAVQDTTAAVQANTAEVQKLVANCGLVPAEIHHIDEASVTDGGGGYPAEQWFPDVGAYPLGYPLGERRTLAAHILVTGTVADGCSLELWASRDGGVTFRNVTADGYCHETHTDGYAAIEAPDATPVERTMDWIFLLEDHIRWRVVMPTGPTGQITVGGMLHGR